MLCQMRSLDVIFASFCGLLLFFLSMLNSLLAMGPVKSDSLRVQVVLGLGSEFSKVEWWNAKALGCRPPPCLCCGFQSETWAVNLKLYQ